MKIVKVTMAIIAVSALAGFSNVANAFYCPGYIVATLINTTPETLYLLSSGAKPGYTTWAPKPPKKLLPGQQFLTKIYLDVPCDSGHEPSVNMYFTYAYAIKSGPGTCYVKLTRNYQKALTKTGPFSTGSWKNTNKIHKCLSSGSLKVKVKISGYGQNSTVTFYPKKRK